MSDPLPTDWVMLARHLENGLEQYERCHPEWETGGRSGHPTCLSDALAKVRAILAEVDQEPDWVLDPPMSLSVVTTQSYGQVTVWIRDGDRPIWNPRGPNTGSRTLRELWNGAGSIIPLGPVEL